MKMIILMSLVSLSVLADTISFDEAVVRVNNLDVPVGIKVCHTRKYENYLHSGLVLNCSEMRLLDIDIEYQSIDSTYPQGFQIYTKFLNNLLEQGFSIVNCYTSGEYNRIHNCMFVR